MEENTKPRNLRDTQTQKIYGNYAKTTNHNENPREYKAWHTSREKLRSFELRFKHNSSEIIDYVPLRIQIQSHNYIAIMCPAFNCVIAIQGHNIQELKNDLRLRKVDWIQQYYPEKFDKPHEDKPIITKIEVLESKNNQEN